MDPASGKLAVVVDHDDGRVSAHTWKAQGPKWTPEHTHSAHEWITTMLAHDPGVMWVESPLVGKAGVRSTIVQAFTSGAAQAALLHLGWEVRLVNVSTWKKRVTGSGKASKDDVGNTVESKWAKGWAAASRDADLIDAAAICLYGREIESTGRCLMDGWGKL